VNDVELTGVTNQRQPDTRPCTTLSAPSWSIVRCGRLN